MIGHKLLNFKIHYSKIQQKTKMADVNMSVMVNKQTNNTLMYSLRQCGKSVQSSVSWFGSLRTFVRNFRAELSSRLT